MSTLELADRQYDILAALRRLGGKATVGDVVAATGLATEDSKSALKSLLESHRGHLAVTDSGELLYEFNPKLIERGTEPLLARLKRRAWALFSKAFKAWIVVMLVVYFVIMVVLVLMALFANQQGGGDSRRGGWGGGGRGRRGGGDIFPMPNFWFWYFIWGSNWRIGRPYYGSRWESTLGKSDRVPFYKKVFAFVFGPDRPHPTRQQRDRTILRLVRSRNGVISTADLVEHTGLPVPEAEDEMGRLIGAYDGEPVVAPNGELAYAFPSLMLSAHGPVAAREPNPAWMRLEYPQALTGNTAGANLLVGGMNAFTLLAGATAPWFIFPRLKIPDSPAAFVALVVVPVVFSLMFFAIPGLRMLGVARENRRRAKRNVRRVVLGMVYAEALGKGAGVTVDDAVQHVSSRLDRKVSPAAVEAALHELAAEFDADVEPDADGRLTFRFPEIRKQFVGTEAVRKKQGLGTRALGDVVYDTGDTQAEADARDQAAFDRALADADLTPLLPSPDRVGFEADWEAVAFDDEMRRRGLVQA